jgi:hypothetical protein
MALPGTLTTLTVTGTYDSAAGTAQGGVVTFTPSAIVLDAAGKVVITTTPIPVALSGGSFSTVLPCTDNAGLVPPTWQYSADVAVPGAQQVFTFYLPQALGGTAGTVDITALASVPGVAAPSGVYYLPNATSPPAYGPSGGGGFLYAFNGALFWLGPSGSPVLVAPA